MINQPEEPDEDAPDPQGRDTAQPDARKQEGPLTNAKQQEVKPNAKKQEI
jgi:hypothetical protein